MQCWCKRRELDVEHASRVRDGIPFCEESCVTEYTRGKANDTLIYEPARPLDVGSWNGA